MTARRTSRDAARDSPNRRPCLAQVHALRRKRILWRGLRAFQQSYERERLRKWVALCKLARSALSIDFVLRTVRAPAFSFMPLRLSGAPLLPPRDGAREPA